MTLTGVYEAVVKKENTKLGGDKPFFYGREDYNEVEEHPADLPDVNLNYQIKYTLYHLTA